MTGWCRRFPAGLLALCVLVACGPRDERSSGPPQEERDAAPARRIVTLAPHLAELVFAAGAGDRLRGVVEFSEHPVAVRALPRVGDAFRVDFESIAGLEPDLILGWPSGNSPATLDRLRRLGYRVVGLEPRTLEDVGRHIAIIGTLAGTSAVADPAAAAWKADLDALRARYSRAIPVSVFYQVAPEPLITVTSAHFIGQAIDLCGGRNVFAAVPGLAPTVSQEAVIAAAPEVIVASALEPGPASGAGASPLDRWQSWTVIPAVERGRLYEIDPGLMTVPGPRMLEGITRLCAAIGATPQPPAAS